MQKFSEQVYSELKNYKSLENKHSLLKQQWRSIEQQNESLKNQQKLLISQVNSKLQILRKKIFNRVQLANKNDEIIKSNLKSISDQQKVLLSVKTPDLSFKISTPAKLFSLTENSVKMDQKFEKVKQQIEQTLKKLRVRISLTEIQLKQLSNLTNRKR